jgi:hypothetical protein
VTARRLSGFDVILQDSSLKPTVADLSILFFNISSVFRGYNNIYKAKNLSIMK